MASSRGSSPAASISSPKSPFQLTPNSKVKALLASLSDESDNESVSGSSARARLQLALSKKPAAGTAENLTRKEEATQESQEEEEDDAIRPMGRMAARMLANTSNVGRDREQSADDARERVKKMFTARTKSPEPIIEKENVEDSEDNDAPVISRKRKTRTARRSTPVTSPRIRSASPGLFVSPAAPRSGTPMDNGSDSDELPKEIDTGTDRFQALVAKKREERLAKEAEATAAAAKKLAARRQQAIALEEDEEISDDDNVELKLTQQQRPTRRAGKRALEDIGRETQRMSRNMQLTHKPITKKKITKNDLFKRFNFPVAGATKEAPTQTTDSSSPTYLSDDASHETPPTSPVQEFVKETSIVEAQTAPNEQLEEADDFSILGAVPNSSPPRKVDKGKGKAIEVPEPSPEPEQTKKKYVFKQQPIRIRRPMPLTVDDSDSDLEIVLPKSDTRTKKLDAIFDSIPEKQAKESHALYVLKSLSHQNSPGKQRLGRNQKPSITATENLLSLKQRMRQQAREAREEKLQLLKDRGIIVQTAEERQQELADVEDLLARARREQDALGQQEKAAAKAERKANGEIDPLGDSSDDEDWQEENQPKEASLSGSDVEMDDSEESENDASGEEEEEEEEDAMDLDKDPVSNPMLDNEADESDDDDPKERLSADEEETGIQQNEMEDEDEEEPMTLQPKLRRARKSHVLSDEEDEGEDSVLETPLPSRFDSPLHSHSKSPKNPHSVLRSATKTFIPGITAVGPVGLGLTQIFAGTMDESQFEPCDASQASQFPDSPQMAPRADAMAFLKRLPAPDLPPFVPTPVEDSQDVIMNSQAETPETQTIETQTQGIQLGFSQSQIHGFDSLIDPMATQMSDFEATQDVGFQNITPIRTRFVEAPPSTVDTVILGQSTAPEAVDATPAVKKKGKLRRRAPILDVSDEEDGEVVAPAIEEDFDISANAFDVMRRATKKQVVIDDFDKKKSEAKTMVNEQAEESEDEYAGLGGASDDESGGEADDIMKEMIDDEGGKDVDEHKMAAYYADRERAEDEKKVEKLYNDISKGMLRRKRGADFDLSDSDDDGAARRRMKQRKFAKMQKALLADERIGKIAEDPKKQAFLRALQDRGSDDDDDMDYLEFKEPEDSNDSQSQDPADESRVPDSQPELRRNDSPSAGSTMRPPPNLRRTKAAAGKKPTTLSEIRDRVSSMIDEPDSLVDSSHYDSDSDDGLFIDGLPNPEKENRDPFALRRTNVAVVDRISLKRQSSSSLSASTRLAFSVSSSTQGFKVPALLRRATTNSSVTSSGNSSVAGGMAGTERGAGAASDGIRRGGGKNSGVNYFARDTARKAAVVKTELKREQKRAKGAEKRKDVVGSLFAGGKFE